MWRSRSARDVVNEMEYLAKECGICYFQFKDENFIGPGKSGQSHAFDIAAEILRRKLKIRYSIACRTSSVNKELFTFLKESGLYKAFIGAESWSQSSLDRLTKNTSVEENMRAVEILESLGLRTIVGFIMFTPESTLEETRHNVDFFRRLESFNLYVESLWRRLEIFAGTEDEHRYGHYFRSKAFYQGNPIPYKFKDRMIAHLCNEALSNFAPWINFFVHTLYQIELVCESKQNNLQEKERLSQISAIILKLTLNLMDDFVALYLYHGEQDQSFMNQEKQLFSKHINAFQENSYEALRLVLSSTSLTLGDDS